MIPWECDSLQANTFEFSFSFFLFFLRKTGRILEIKITLELNLELKLEKNIYVFGDLALSPWKLSPSKSFSFDLSQEYSGKGKKELAFGVLRWFERRVWSC